MNLHRDIQLMTYSLSANVIYILQLLPDGFITGLFGGAFVKIPTWSYKTIWDYDHISVHPVRFHVKISREFCSQRTRAHLLPNLSLNKPTEKYIRIIPRIILKVTRRYSRRRERGIDDSQAILQIVGWRSGWDLNGCIHMQMFCRVLIDPGIDP